MNNPIPTTAEGASQQAHKFGEETLKAAREHVVAPAMEAVESARAYASETYAKTSKQVEKQLATAEEYASQKLNESARWVEANPWPAIGAGFLIGLLIGASASSSRRW